MAKAKHDFNEKIKSKIKDWNQKTKMKVQTWKQKTVNQLEKLSLPSKFKIWESEKITIKAKKDLIAPMENGKKVLAEIQNLKLGFKDPAQPDKLNIVIRDTSFKLYEGEIFALIGESGSGKSVISSTLYGMVGDNAIIQSGKVKLFDQEVQNFSQKHWDKAKYRGGIISGIFQNPMTTLNPTMKIKYQIMEGILLNGYAKSRKEAYKIALEYLRKTRINNPEKVMNLYPHELSGGMKQRVVISSIIACRPKIVVMDEPTTALDPSVQADILDIIKNLAQEFKISIIFITHDLGVVASIANRIAIMYAGQIVEIGLSKEILYYPQHPYAWGLLMSMPDLNKSKRLETIKGSVPGSLNDITWDAFAARNDFAMGKDFLEEAPFFQVSPTHFAKTWLLDQRAEKYSPPEIIQNRWKQFHSKEEIYVS